MNRTISRKLSHVKRLFRHLWLWDAVGILFLELIHRQSRLNVRVGGVDLIVRTGTPDLRVAFSSLIDGEYDELELQDAAVIIDAGANIGTTAIAFARRYPNATIVAIEPEAENFGILEQNVRAWTNVRPLKAALTAESGEMPLLDRGTGSWGYTVTDSHQTVRELGQTVRCLTLNQVCDQFGFASVDILKLDIEGGEKDVLDNADDWIGNVRVLVAELHDRIVPDCRAAFDGATRLFKRHTQYGEKRVAYR